MTITITTSTITSGMTGSWERPVWISIECIANIEGEVFTAPWHVCIAEIERRFPEVEFTAVWVGHVCTFTPVGIRHFEAEPTCEIFEREG